MDPDTQILIEEIESQGPTSSALNAHSVMEWVTPVLPVAEIRIPIDGIESEGPISPAPVEQMQLAMVCATPGVPFQPLSLEHGGSLPTEQSTTIEVRQLLPKKDLDETWLRDMVESIQENNKSHTQIKPECSIFKVPADMGQFDSEAYKPKVITIGPHHISCSSSQEDEYKDMQCCKLRCLGSLISRHEGTPADDLLSRCIAKMMSHEERILSYYSKYERNGITSEALAETMMLDGCFILQILLDPDHFQERSHNQVTGRLWIWSLAMVQTFYAFYPYYHHMN